jgi:tripartite ATP-independent transporter DctP family solute receptor
MKRRTFVQQVALASSGVLGFARAGRAAPAVLRFSHTDEPTGLRQQAAEMFGQKIAQYTDGRYKLQVYPAGQLADDIKAVEQLNLGGIDFTVTGTGSYATHIDSLNLTQLPFLIETYQQGWKLYDESKWMQQQYAKGPAVGFRFLPPFEAGFRSLSTRKSAATPAEAKGMKLRSFPNEMLRWTLEAMGFGVQVMPLTDVYMAIRQGVVDGQENPIDTIYTNKFYEVAPYITLTQHVYSPIPLAISEKTWQKLSQADREAVTKAAKEASDWSRTQVVANDERELKEMAGKDAKIVRPDLAPWRAAVQSVYAKAKDKYGAEVNVVLADADAIRKALPAG